MIDNWLLITNDWLLIIINNQEEERRKILKMLISPSSERKPPKQTLDEFMMSNDQDQVKYYWLNLIDSILN